jgi:hypothetical protein
VETARDDEFVFNEIGPIPGSEDQDDETPTVTLEMHKVWIYGKPDLTLGGPGAVPSEISVKKIECKCRESEFWQGKYKRCMHCSWPKKTPNYIPGC